MSTARVKSLLSLSTKCQSHIQAVGDMLLLSCTLRPVRIPTLTAFRNNYPKYRELIITRTKGLLVLTNRLNEQLYEANARWEDISQSLQDMDDLVVTLTECCAHAAYLVTSNKPGSVPAIPGIVDPYVVRRCSLEVNLSCQCLQQTELSDWTPPMLVDVCSNINKSLAILSDSFKAASEKSREKMISQQFKLCVKSMTTSASCFLSAVKCFKAQPTTSHYWQCRSFAEALASSTKAAVLFATEEQFIGKPAQLTPQADELRKTILGACMSIVATCIQLCRIIRDLACDNTNTAQRQRIHQCSNSISRSVTQLAESLPSNLLPDPASGRQLWNGTSAASTTNDMNKQ